MVVTKAYIFSHRRCLLASVGGVSALQNLQVSLSKSQTDEDIFFLWRYDKPRKNPETLPQTVKTFDLPRYYFFKTI